MRLPQGALRLVAVVGLLLAVAVLLGACEPLGTAAPTIDPNATRSPARPQDVACARRQSGADGGPDRDARPDAARHPARPSPVPIP